MVKTITKQKTLDKTKIVKNTIIDLELIKRT